MREGREEGDNSGENLGRDERDEEENGIDGHLVR